jgi:hypothetical protein
MVFIEGGDIFSKIFNPPSDFQGTPIGYHWGGLIFSKISAPPGDFLWVSLGGDIFSKIFNPPVISRGFPLVGGFFSKISSTGGYLYAGVAWKRISPVESVPIQTV